MHPAIGPPRSAMRGGDRCGHGAAPFGLTCPRSTTVRGTGCAPTTQRRRGGVVGRLRGVATGGVPARRWAATATTDPKSRARAPTGTLGRQRMWSASGVGRGNHAIRATGASCCRAPSGGRLGQPTPPATGGLAAIRSRRKDIFGAK